MHFPEWKCLNTDWDLISLKFVPHGPINNIQALVQIMAWRQPGGKPLFGPMMVRLPTHVCVTQWVNELRTSFTRLLSYAPNPQRLCFPVIILWKNNLLSVFTNKRRMHEILKAQCVRAKPWIDGDKYITQFKTCRRNKVPYRGVSISNLSQPEICSCFMHITVELY